MEIRLYTADVGVLADAALFETLYRAVSPARRAQTERVRPPAGKRLSLGAGALLEAALAELGVRAPRYSYGPNGKPCLADRDDLHFNLSHSGTRVLCAISDRAVGCDVERLRAARLAVAKRCFCAAEYRALLDCADEAARDRLFYQLWTLKESFMKATGLGFQLPLNAFQLQITENGISVAQQLDARPYCFRSFFTDGYAYALCCAGRPPDGVGLSERDFSSLAALLTQG